jgi:ribose-phosphate pyrophosphokinase
VAFQSSDDIITALMLVDALKRMLPNQYITLKIPYFPYARQDRVCNTGESHSLKVIADLIIASGVNKVAVHDAHSDVLLALFPAGMLHHIEQHVLLAPGIKEIIERDDKEKVALLAPDAGALKKTYKLAKTLGIQKVFRADKLRDTSTGKIIATIVHDHEDLEEYQHIIIADDICDGGRTFIELANAVRKDYTGKLSLSVTHGIFSAGIGKLTEVFDCVLMFNDLRG